MRMGALDWIAWVLVIIGGINWGLIGLFDFNLVTMLFGESLTSSIIYIIVGVAAIYLLFAIPARRTRV